MRMIRKLAVYWRELLELKRKVDNRQASFEERELFSRMFQFFICIASIVGLAAAILSQVLISVL